MKNKSRNVQSETHDQHGKLTPAEAERIQSADLPSGEGSNRVPLEEVQNQARVADAFIKALQKIEKSKHPDELEAMVNLFSDESELSSLALPVPFYGKAGVYRFWRDYLGAFETVESRFTKVIETKDHGVLEWVAKGRLHSGRPFEYRGVTLLEFDGDRVKRFCSYYDSAAFLNPRTQAAA